MEIIVALAVVVILLGGVILYGAKEFGLNKTECSIVVIGGTLLAIASFWW